MLKQKATFVPQRGERSPALSPVRRETVLSNSWCIARPYVRSDCRVLLYAAVTLTHHANAVIFLFFFQTRVLCWFYFPFWHRLTQLLKPASNSDENLPPTGCTLATSLLIFFLFCWEKKVVPTVVLSCFLCCVWLRCVRVCWLADAPWCWCICFLLFLFFAIQSQWLCHNTITVPSKPLQICQPQRQVISLAFKKKKPIIHILIQCHCEEWTTVKSLNECVQG